jgi:hypothetical protein
LGFGIFGKIKSCDPKKNRRATSPIANRQSPIASFTHSLCSVARTSKINNLDIVASAPKQNILGFEIAMDYANVRSGKELDATQNLPTNAANLR